MLLIPRGFPLILWGKTMELSVFISLRSLFPNILGSIDTFRHTRLVQCPYPEEELSVIMCVDYAVSVTQLKTITNSPAFHLKKKKEGGSDFFSHVSIKPCFLISDLHYPAQNPLSPWK